MSPTQFTRALRRLLDTLGLSTAQAARRIGVPVRTMAAWRIGARTPKEITQRAVLAALDVPGGPGK